MILFIEGAFADGHGYFSDKNMRIHLPDRDLNFIAFNVQPMSATETETKAAGKAALKRVRRRALEADLTMSDLIARCGCSAQAFYGAIQDPRRYPRVHKRLEEVLP
jgi:hypothetical protein